MPYTTSKSDGKVTVSKKVGDRSKVVGHTTPGKKNDYLAALHNNSKDKNEGADVGQEFDNQVGDMYAVQRPYDGCEPGKLVHKIDPLQGAQGIGVEPVQIFGAYLEEDVAMNMAEKLYKEFTGAAMMLEKKKAEVIERIKETIDKLEDKRRVTVEIIKENPKESGAHKETIAQLATKI